MEVRSGDSLPKMRGIDETIMKRFTISKFIAAQICNGVALPFSNHFHFTPFHRENENDHFVSFSPCSDH